MKKALLTAAVLAASTGAVQAQSNVTVYGLIDAGIVSEHGGKAGSLNKLSGGVGSSSRLGFRGTEELGSGLAAVFVLETGFKTDTGEVDTAGSLFNRQAFVGLKSANLGTVTVGRQYTPWYTTLSQVADPFAAGLAGSAKNLFPAAGVNTRTSNTVLYATPNFSGVSAEAAYSVGEQAGDSTAGRQFGLAVGYANGPLNARLAYNSRNSDVAAAGTTAAVSRDLGTNILLAVNYNFGIAKAYFAYGKDKGFNSAVLPNSTAYTTAAVAPSIDSNEVLIGATAQVGSAGTLIASYIRKDDKQQFNRDANQWAVGYSYALSKRTSTYASYAKIKNKNGASYTVGNSSEAGSGDKALNVGLRHSF